MGYSVFLVKDFLGAGSVDVRLFAFHYLLNLTWAPFFFGLHRVATAGWINVGLLTSLAAVMVRFHKTSRLAAGLLAPYFAWLAFATALNFEIWRLNRTQRLKHLEFEDQRSVGSIVRSSSVPIACGLMLLSLVRAFVQACF